MINETKDEADEFLAGLGFTEEQRRDLTPEEEFYEELILGKMPKIANIRYWLMHEMSKFQFLKEKELILQVKDTKVVSIPGAVAATTTKNITRDITLDEYGKLSLEYYLLMYHLPRFKVIESEPQRRVCSLSKMVELIAGHESIKDVVHKKY